MIIQHMKLAKRIAVEMVALIPCLTGVCPVPPESATVEDVHE